MLSIPKYPEQYAQHFPTIFYLLCCASQHHVALPLERLPFEKHWNLAKGTTEPTPHMQAPRRRPASPPSVWLYVDLRKASTHWGF